MSHDDSVFLELCAQRLESGRTYKYKELCSILDEDIKKSNAKKSQMKRWGRFFRWENPTTHTYKIIEIYDNPMEAVDGRRRNGGARSNSGAKPKVQEEFDYLFNAFLHREFSRNSYNGQSNLCVSYFFNGEISRYFGMYSDEFYKAKDDFANLVIGSMTDEDKASSKISEFNDAWSDINKKISEKRRTWIYNKIDSINGVTLENGIIAYIDKGDKEFEYKDEYLERWNGYMDDYVKERKLRNVADVAERGLWKDMLEYISDNFKEYETVERTKKITFDVRVLREYEWGEYESYRKRFNTKLADELISFFSKRIPEDSLNMYRYIIDKYVKI